MPAVEITTIPIRGYAGRPLPNRLFRQARAHRLALILPGLRYSCDMPLLFYPARLMTQRGAAVLQVLSDYTQAAYQSASKAEQARWLAEDAQAALKAGLAAGDFQEVILIGKSIGSLALASLVAGGVEAPSIWLTPLLRQPFLIEAARQQKGPALFIGSSSDPTFDLEQLQRIQATGKGESLVIAGADHSLEIPGDVFASLEILRQILERIQAFLEDLPASRGAEPETLPL
jgi:predicted alpha/beta-hydrolase family hydrolase